MRNMNRQARSGHRIRGTISSLLFGLAAAVPAHAPAATYDASWNVIASGGVTFVTSGAYTLGSTVAQPANWSLAAGTYTLSSGFWYSGIGVLPVQVLDIDGNGSYDALTDGLLVLRYLFGLTGTPLTSGTIGVGATRSDPATVVAYLDSVRTALDVDGNGATDALTDGLLVIRYLFGLTGSSLISGAVAPNATRTTAPDIQAYIVSLMP